MVRVLSVVKSEIYQLLKFFFNYQHILKMMVSTESDLTSYLSLPGWIKHTKNKREIETVIRCVTVHKKLFFSLFILQKIMKYQVKVLWSLWLPKQKNLVCIYHWIIYFFTEIIDATKICSEKKIWEELQVSLSRQERANILPIKAWFWSLAFRIQSCTFPRDKPGVRKYF